MNGQYLCNRAISISYAFKKDSKGERHGRYATFSNTQFIMYRDRKRLLVYYTIDCN